MRMVAVLIAGLALVVAVYGAWLSTQSDRRQRKSDIKVECQEKSGFAGQKLVIGETLHLEHILTVRVINDGEAPEYVHEIFLESEHPSPLKVNVRAPKGTKEVRPRDHQTFDLELDGSQGFEWDKNFRAVVVLANKQQFYSGYGWLDRPPHHGEARTIPDPEKVPDGEVAHICLPPGSRVATVSPPSEEVT